MPLTRRQFELGIDQDAEDLMRQLYLTLEANKNLAFSFQELRQKVLGQAPGYAEVEGLRQYVDRMNRVPTALDVLAGIGAVDKRKVAGTDYFAFHREFDTAFWEPKS